MPFRFRRKFHLSLSFLLSETLKRKFSGISPILNRKLAKSSLSCGVLRSFIRSDPRTLSRFRTRENLNTGRKLLLTGLKPLKKQKVCKYSKACVLWTPKKWLLQTRLPFFLRSTLVIFSENLFIGYDKHSDYPLQKMFYKIFLKVWRFHHF